MRVRPRKMQIGHALSAFQRTRKKNSVMTDTVSIGRRELDELKLIAQAFHRAPRLRALRQNGDNGFLSHGEMGIHLGRAQFAPGTQFALVEVTLALELVTGS
jgi:hypothetical protein